MTDLIQKLSNFSNQIGKLENTFKDSDRHDEVNQLKQSFKEIKLQVESLLKAENKAHKHYQSLVNLLPEVVFELDLEGNILSMNSYGLERLGFTEKDLIEGKLNISNIIHPDDLARAQTLLQKNLSGKRITGNEFHMLSKSKEEIIAQIFNTPIIENKKIIGLRGIAVDITQRKKIEIQVRENIEKYKGIFDNSPLGIGYYTKDGILTDCNEKFACMLGNSPENLRGFNIFKDLQNKGLLAALKDSLEIGPASYEGVYHAVLTGRKAPTRVLFQGIKNELGEIYGGIALAEDISERVAAENALKESEEKFRHLVEYIGEGAAITDENNRFTFANPAAEMIFGVEKNGLINRYLHEFLTPEEFERILLETEKRKEGLKSTYELQITRPDKETRDILVTVTPNNNKLGDYIQSLGIFRDITKRKIIERELKDAHEILIKNNRELQQAKEKAEESDRLKSAFLATMSHELRTPLISIIGLSELMDSSMSMEEVLEFAQSIHKSGAQLDSLIDDIFNVSQLEAGNLKPTIEEFEVNDILRNVQNQGYTQLADAGKNAISLKLDCPENMGDLWIRSDKAMFQKIFQILIHNAIKFTTEGDIIFGFKISGENKPCFFVKDNGIGIPIDKQHLLFERFRQLDQNHNRLYGGIGLGLYSSKKMVEALGGKIWFDSMDGKGSTFYFLPGSSKSTSV